MYFNNTLKFLVVVGLLSVGVGVGLKVVNNFSQSVAPEVKLISTVPVVNNTVASTTQHVSGNYKTSELSLPGNRFVYVTGVIGEANSTEIAKQILLLGRTSEPITLIINSPGGSVLDGAQIISAMEAARGPVNTLCVSLCASMAAMIHQYGTHRLMINRSILMFHPAAGGMEGTLEQQNSRLTLFKSFIGKMEQNVAKRAGVSFAEYKLRSNVELWLDAEDSLAQHYADQIVFVRGADANKIYPNRFDDVQVNRKVNPANPQLVPGIPNIPRLDWF